MRFESERRAVVQAAQRMESGKLVINTSGNVSVRAGDWIAITPNAIDYMEMTAADVCLINVATGEEDGMGGLLPSSELPLHLAIYRTTSAGAVVHTHSHFATVLSTIEDRLPPIHYQIADLGGQVPVAPYATFGSDELASVTARYLRDGNAVLMRNHGVTTVGNDLRKALARAFAVEWIASVYCHARVLGSPHLLDDVEIARVRAKQQALANLRAERLSTRSK